MTRIHDRPARHRIALAAALAVLATWTADAWTGDAVAQQPALTGTATYRERMALPADAAFEATIRDVTRTDRPSELIGRTRIEPIQQLPIRFAIPYDPNLVKPGHRYTLQARIVADGRLLFATTDAVPVFDGDPAAPIDVVLPRSAGIAINELTPPSSAPAQLGRLDPPAVPIGPPMLLGPASEAPPARTRRGPPAIAPAYDVPSPAGPLPAQSQAQALAGPPQSPPADASDQAFGPLVPLPATFAGTLPCADCEGIRHSLMVSPDRAFTLQLEYLGRPGDPGYVYRGQWVLDEETRVLTLSSDRQRPLAFAIKDPNRLRMLDAAGREIVSELNYDLTRSHTLERGTGWRSVGQASAGQSAGQSTGQSAAASTAPRTGSPQALPAPAGDAAPGYLLRGFYRAAGDSSQFVECGGGRPVPIAPRQGEAPELQRAYESSQRRPGDEVLVEVEGRIAIGPRPDGNSLGRILVVDRFIGLRPGETCTAAEVRAITATADAPVAAAAQPPAEPDATVAAAPQPPAAPAAPDAPLRGTYWKLTRIGSQAVTTPAGLEEPHLLLNPDARRFDGHSGCNGIGGQFFIDNRYLTFSLGPSTLRACEGGMEQERAYRSVLETTEGWSVAGNRLTLYDADGTPALRFQAGNGG